jgi:hypothetical protein
MNPHSFFHHHHDGTVLHGAQSHSELQNLLANSQSNLALLAHSNHLGNTVLHYGVRIPSGLQAILAILQPQPAVNEENEQTESPQF